jgi:S-adenosylmethionine-dependent methyltransferase
VPESSLGPGVSPRSVVVWEVLSAVLAEADPGHRGLDIVDAGGGTGGIAVPLAHAGHRVTVVDPSHDALAALARRAAERGLEDRILGVQGDLADLADLVPAGSLDLVLCHSVLEVVDDPAASLGQVARALRPGGRLSLLVAGRDAAVLGRALAGRPDEAAHVLTDPRGRWGPSDPASRRWTPAALSALVVAAGFEVEQVHGVRTVADLVPSAVQEADPGVAAALVALERALSDQLPFRDLATQLHLLARRPGPWAGAAPAG